MWFDAQKALGDLGGGFAPPSMVTPPAPHRLAQLARIARPSAPAAECVAPCRTDGLGPDTGSVLDLLSSAGPLTYGAIAKALGWGATRAWLVEAELVATGLVERDGWGRSCTRDADRG
jgi:hypothetical protein